MADELPLVRQWLLLRKLCGWHYGVTIKDMMHEFGVSEKTVRRDLETFEKAGFPLKETVGEFGRKTWHLEAGNDQPGLHFAYDEAIALYLGRRFLEPLAGDHVLGSRPKGIQEGPCQPGTERAQVRRSVRHHVPPDDGWGG